MQSLEFRKLNDTREPYHMQSQSLAFKGCFRQLFDGDWDRFGTCSRMFLSIALMNKCTLV